MRYFIIVASKDHIQNGTDGSFTQADHGKKTNLSKLTRGDWIIFYASKESFPTGKPVQKFTAIGQVVDEEPYKVVMKPGFEPWRRKIKFCPAKEVEIRPLLDDLKFIINKKRWGLHLISGFLEIGRHDFERIAGEMLEEPSVCEHKAGN